MSREKMEEIARDELELAGMIEMDEKLALVAINSFVTAYELLKPQVA